ncbi:MAG: alpha/beta hydrolase, partial [Polyangiaceae bacterium]
MSRQRGWWAVVLVGVFWIMSLSGEAGAAGKVLRDVKFASAGDTPLLLDLYLPEQKPIGLIVWVHGGAWRAGSKSQVDLQRLTEKQWAVASVDYRLSPVAKF